MSWRTAIDDVALLWATDRSSHAGHFTSVSRWAMRLAPRPCSRLEQRHGEDAE